MSLNERVIRARVLAEEGSILSYDKQDRVKTAVVPASKATRNQLIIRRGTYRMGAQILPMISVECDKMVGRAGNVICPGAEYNFCRHQIAAIFLATWHNGYEPKFRKDFNDAQSLAARASSHNAAIIHDDQPLVFRVKSHRGHEQGLWMVPLHKRTARSLKRKGIKL